MVSGFGKRMHIAQFIWMRSLCQLMFLLFQTELNLTRTRIIKAFFKVFS